MSHSKPAANGFRLIAVAGLIASLAAPAQAADVAAGKAKFEDACGLCHSAVPGDGEGGMGPDLYSLNGKAAGTGDKAFPYTAALKNSKLVWSAETLDQFLTAPKKAVPGTAMVVAIPAKAMRDDVVPTCCRRRRPPASNGLYPISPWSYRMTAHLKTACGLAAVILLLAGASQAQVLNGPAAFGDYTADKPGVTRKFGASDLPAPDMSGPPKIYPKVADKVVDGQMQTLPGFTVTQYGEALQGPRALNVAPNGDIFVSEGLAGRVRVLRPGANGAAPASVETFAEGLNGPFGIAFYPAADPQWVYVAENNTVKRFPYRSGDLKARGAPEVIIETLAATTGGHITRDLAFTADGKRMLVSVGSQSNFAKLTPKSPEEIAAFERDNGLGAAWDSDTGRATVLSFTPEGKDRRPFATGIRNCVDLARNPATGDFYCTVNERDALGDNLVPDYFTRVKQGGFYGWPWFYIGEHEEPRVTSPRPDLKGKITVPDVLFQSHSAPLGAAFYPANASGPGAFPAEYRGDVFVALHGSQNRATRTGHKIVRIKLKDGVPTGEYQDFVTGLVLDTVNVLGRPSGIAVLQDGSLLFSDDVAGRLWRVAYTGR